MLTLFFKTKKKKRTLEESVLLIKQGDQKLLNDLIDSYKPFIAKTVSSVCKRYIHETDDEFSIGLIAFNDAIHKYSSERGRSLLSFAEVLIKRRVIDYIRKQTRNPHISLQFNHTSQEDESSGISIVNELSCEDYQNKMENEQRKEEIIQFQELLKTFELSLDDLVKCTPKHADARINAILIAKTLVEHDELQKLLRETKRLPIKQLEQMVSVSRKTIERNRKYIIAIALIFMGDSIYLKDYLKGVLEV